MSAPFPACWSADNARRVFLTEALEGGDAVFLATHTPIRGFHVAGSAAGDIAGDDEQAILDALSDPERRHAFCVVQGEPGSGKSHLIRWLSINWPVANDVKLLLRRADGSLEGALQQLKTRLPAEFGSLFDNLGQRQRATVEGRANIFATILGVSLEPGHFSKPIGDEEWCRKFAPGDLLNDKAVRNAWQGPARILRLLEGAGGARNSATASFDLFDIQDLARASRVGTLGRTATELARRLLHEAEEIASYRQQEWRADELATEKPELFRTSLTLMKALNARRNDAIRNVIGVSAEGLKSLFRNVRSALVARKQRLVLLLEDITSWEGLDDSLLDVLIDNAEAHGGEGDAPVCPLISVVGVTPDFYNRLPGNNRQRITHEIKLGQSQGGLQDVATLREADDRRAFVARYLASVRAGVPALEDWRERARQSPGTPTPLPNACSPCVRRNACFKTFGPTLLDEESVGLFPFTARALDRFFEALKENDNGQTWRTPRGLLQAVLNPNLIKPEALDEGRFPHALIEPSAFREDHRSDRVLANRLDAIVSNRIDNRDERARMRRMLAYWAEPARADTTEVDGELAFAGARRSLYEAFGLPWIGSSIASPDSQVVVLPGPELPLLPPEGAGDEPTPVTAPHSSPGRPNPPPRAAASSGPPSKPKRLTATRNQLDQYRVDLRTWADGGNVEKAAFWNRALYDFVQRIDPRRFGVAPRLFQRIVTAEMVKLQGSSSGQRQYLVVPRERWAVDGLEAYLTLGFERDKALSNADVSFHRRNLGLMMRRLEQAATAYLDTRVPRLKSGARWSPAVAVAQVLLARAWLRGTTAPDASVPDQMRAILSDEPEPTSDPKARSEPWQAWLSSTDKWHDRLRGELRELVSLAGDGAGGAGLVDASDIAGAIARMKDTGKTDEMPEQNGGLPDVLAQARELAGEWRDKRLLIERTERDQLKGRIDSLFTLLRGRSITEHLSRVDHAVTTVSNLLKEVAPEMVQNWKETHSCAMPRIRDGVGRGLEEFMASFDDPEQGLPQKTVLRLGWMARAPAGDLADVLDLAKLGEKLVGQLHTHADDCIRETGDAVTLAGVQRIGVALQAASRYASECGS